MIDRSTKPLMTLAQVCEVLGISIRQVRGLVADGALVGVRTGEGGVYTTRITTASVQALINGRRDYWEVKA